MAIPSVTSISTAPTAAISLANLVLVSPNLSGGYQPYRTPGPIENLGNLPFPDAFVFNYEGEQSLTCESDITDHYIETNTSIQDQIALKPVIISTQGFIGELNDVVPTILSPLFAVAQKLTVISAYQPALSVTATIAYNKAFQLYQTATNAAAAAISAWASVTAAPGGLSGVLGNATVINGTQVTQSSAVQTKQQIAFQQFYGWWVNRILFNVLTPWALFQNMAIKTLKPVQNEESASFTTFELTFKQIRTATAAIKVPTSSISQNRLIGQSSSVTNQGFSSPQPSLPLSTGLSQSYPGAFA